MNALTGFGLGMVALAATSGVATANINLEFRPADQSVFVGDTVNIELYAVSDSAFPQSLSALQAVFAWDPGFLTLLGLDDTGGLLSSGFPTTDPFNLNESSPPQDGDGFYLALANLGTAIDATPEGTLITTFMFEALLPTAATPVDLLPSGGAPAGSTIVFDGTIPNLNVTGNLFGASIEILAVPGPAALGLLLVAGVTRRRRR